MEKIVTESARRSALKALSYRICGTLVTVLVAWWVSGSIGIGGLIGVLDFVFKLCVYYAHERVWAHVNSIGRKTTVSDMEEKLEELVTDLDGNDSSGQLELLDALRECQEELRNFVNAADALAEKLIEEEDERTDG